MEKNYINYGKKLITLEATNIIKMGFTIIIFFIFPSYFYFLFNDGLSWFFIVAILIFLFLLWTFKIILIKGSLYEKGFLIQDNFSKRFIDFREISKIEVFSSNTFEVGFNIGRINIFTKVGTKISVPFEKEVGDYREILIISKLKILTNKEPIEQKGIFNNKIIFYL